MDTGKSLDTGNLDSSPPSNLQPLLDKLSRIPLSLLHINTMEGFSQCETGSHPLVNSNLKLGPEKAVLAYVHENLGGPLAERQNPEEILGFKYLFLPIWKNITALDMSKKFIFDNPLRVDLVKKSHLAMKDNDFGESFPSSIDVQKTWVNLLRTNNNTVSQLADFFGLKLYQKAMPTELPDFTFSRNALAIMRRSVWYSYHQNKRITSRNVLFSVIDEFLQNNDSPLFGFIPNLYHKRRDQYETKHKQYLPGNPPSRFTLSTKPFQNEEQLPNLSLNVIAILMLADEICSGKNIHSRHLLAAILLYEKETGARRLLEKLGCDIENLKKEFLAFALKTYPSEREVWKKYFSPAGAGSIAGSKSPDRDKDLSMGTQYRISREASEDEECLDVDKYADVLSRLFLKAEGEFCFGLFGHWGRGKTYLMRLIGNSLKKEGYAVINFNAWKYRSTPETWVHLYQNFYDTVKRLGFWSRLSVVTRAAIVKNGVALSAVTFLAFGLAVLLASLKIRHSGIEIAAASQWGKMIGGSSLFASLGGGFSLFKIFQQSQDYFANLKKFSPLTDHKEKLGLQATIGHDLKALIIGWIPESYFRKPKFLWFLVAFVLPIITLIISISQISGLLSISFPWNGNVGESLIGLFLLILLSTILLLISLMTSVALLVKRNKTSKILLVVDDLDRCQPEQMLEIVESLKLLLEEDEIRNLVQVAVLVEEKTLRNAIIKKFIPASETNPSFPKIVNEHIEKLLLCYLRLPELSEKELIEVMRNFISANKNNIADIPKPTDGNPSKIKSPEDPIVPLAPPNLRENKAPPVGGEPIKPEEQIENEEYISSEINEESTLFSEDEEQWLYNVIPELSKTTGRNWGPRALRIFVFKYQLCRLLLIKFGGRLDLPKLIPKLCEAIARRDENSEKNNTPTSNDQTLLIEKIVHQVA